MEPLLHVEAASVIFRVGGGLLTRGAALTAVNRATFALQPGETLGVVGESGCGKSTLGRIVGGEIAPTHGRVFLAGRDIAELPRTERAKIVQPIAQDPRGALDPRWRIGDLLAEPLVIHGRLSAEARRRRVRAALAEVRLPAAFANRFPHQLSGGQAQRVVIARALMLQPRLLVCDEPVSALDAAVQSDVVRLFLDIQRAHGTSLVFVSHDLRLVRQISHRIAVMYLGHIVELGPADAIGGAQSHPYTRALIGAAPRIDLRNRRSKRATLDGETPSPVDLPTGCVFHPRCPIAVDRCRTTRPPEIAVGDGHRVACHLAGAETERSARRPVAIGAGG